jgi:hypothetical protein
MMRVGLPALTVEWLFPSFAKSPGILLFDPCGPGGVANSGLSVVSTKGSGRIAGRLVFVNTTAIDIGPGFPDPWDEMGTGCTGRIGSSGTGCRMMGGGAAADSGMTPVESRGMMTSTPATIISTVNAVAMGQRLPLRGADEDSSSVSPNIFLTSMEVI